MFCDDEIVLVLVLVLALTWDWTDFSEISFESVKQNVKQNVRLGYALA
jgi:hypothetical protein